MQVRRVHHHYHRIHTFTHSRIVVLTHTPAIGYTERATALFQAQAELTYHTPRTHARTRLPALLDALEAFWDAEWPRAGEAGARGWGVWEGEGRPECVPAGDPSSDQRREQEEGEGDASADADPLARWAAAEARADRTHVLPLRAPSLSSSDDPDPYATVLFGDIKPLLSAPYTTSRARRAFRLAWLSFAGAHVPGLVASLSPSPSSTDDRWALTHLTSPALLSLLLPSPLSPSARPRAESHAGALLGPESSAEGAGAGRVPVKEWGVGVVRPVEEAAGLRMWDVEDVRGVWGGEGMVRGVFDACRVREGEGENDDEVDEEWDLMRLSYEGAVSVRGYALLLTRKLLVLTS